MASYLNKAIKILICLTFFVPLFLVPTSFIFPFIVPKILAFRSLVLLMLGAYLLLLQVNWRKYKITFNWIDCAVLFFFTSFAVSTFVGVDWYKSFWDNHERMLGLFTIFHFVVYYFIVSKAVEGWKEWRVLLRVFLFAGLIVMFIGMIQKANPDFLLNRDSDRVSATLGNAIYYSGYGLFLLFVGLLLAIKEKAGENILRLRSGQAFWFWYAVVGGVFGFLGIFWGGTKGTFLGLVISGIILLFTYLFTAREQKKLKYIAFGLIFLILVALGILFNFRRTNFVQDIPAVGNLMNISLGGTTETRLMAWDVAIKAWQEKPVFGWGPNNYYYAFNKYYNPKFLEHGWGETWFDNAHSAVMNTLAVQGTVGFLSYFLLFIVSAVILIKSFLAGRLDKHVLAVGLAFLAGHFVHNATVFENPTSYLYFFFFLAFINSLSSISYNLSPIKKTEQKHFSVGLLTIITFIILLIIYSTNINPARANMSSFNTMRALYNNPIAGIEVYKKTITIPSPHIDDIRNDFARVINEITTAMMSSKMDIGKIKEILNIALQESQKNRELHPLDIRIHLQQAQLNSLYTLISNNANYLLEAEKNLMDALAISPKRQQIQYMLAMVELQLNKPQEAVRLLEDSIANDDKIGEGWARLIYVYSQTGQKEKAVAFLEEAKNKSISFDERLQGIINMALPDNQNNK